MIPTTLRKPATADPAHAAAIKAAKAIATSKPATWLEPPAAPFLRAGSSRIWCIQLASSTSDITTLNLWYIQMQTPSVHTGGHWSPLVSPATPAMDLLLLTSPQTHESLPVELVHAFFQTSGIISLNLGQALGLPYRPAALQLLCHPQGQQILIHGQCIVTTSVQLQPVDSTRAQNQSETTRLPGNWLTLEKQIPRLLRVESVVTEQGRCSAMGHAHDVQLSTALGDLHPMLRDVRPLGLRYYDLPSGVVLHALSAWLAPVAFAPG
ncbi:MAG: hypothetical protein HC898_11565 [Phycisphaerales bacterium]|nr:hypothetical protein [Phycisphaerales bacterium]